MSTATLRGRQSELDALTAAFENPDLAAVVVSAPPAVGRTALLRAWAATLPRWRASWVSVTAETARLPFGPFAGLLADAAGDAAAPLESVVALVAETRSAAQRRVLIVDDAHLLDPDSVGLLQHLTAAGDALVVASVDQTAPGAEVFDRLCADFGGQLLPLAPLPAAELGPIACGLFDGYLDPGAARALIQLAESRPGVLIDACQAGLADGFLVKVESVWQLHLPDHPGLRLRRLVDRVIGPLTADERECLTLVAAAERLTGAQIEALRMPRAVVDGLEARGILTSSASAGEVDFAVRQPIVAQVLRGSVSPGRAQSLAVLLAETLADLVDDPVRLAKWHVEAGRRTDPGLLLRGATGAANRYDYELALRLADDAAASGAGFEAGLLAARMVGSLHGPDAADERLEQLVTVAASDDERGRLAVARLHNLTMSTTRRGDGLRIAAAAEASIADPQWRDRIEVLRIVGTVIPVSGPRVAGELLLRLLERNTDPAARASMSYTTAYCLGRVGQIETALEVARKGYAEHLTLDNSMEWRSWQNLWAQCEALLAAGRLAEAEKIAQKQYHLGLEGNDLAERAWFARCLAANCLATGRVRTAAEYARESASLYSQLGEPRQATWASITLSTALALSGRPDSAETVLRHGLEDHAFSSQVDALAARAWIAVARGDLTEARRHLTEAADQGRRSSDLVGAISALHDLARLGYARQVQQDLDITARGFEGELVAARRLHVDGLCAHDAPRLLAASEAFAGMGSMLLAAEAAFDAAVAWRKVGNTRGAVAAERTGALHASRCEGAQTPALGRVQTRLRLTPAELDTALLASAGHTNREIAEMQHLALKTVKNRLLGIYVKLGASGRGDLTEILYPEAQAGSLGSVAAR